MNILDIVALAKAGYKRKDIEELLAMKEPEPEKNEPEKEPEKAEDKKEVEKEPEKEEPETDELTKVKEQLKEAQEANKKKDLSTGQETDEDIFTKALSLFL